MIITLNEILQVDATTIAGIIILLTITKFLDVEIKESVEPLANPRKGVALVISPFSVSIIIILIANLSPYYTTEEQLPSWFTTIPVFLTVLGFAWLALVINRIAKLKEAEPEIPSRMKKIIKKLKKFFWITRRERKEQKKWFTKRYEKL